jgi:hypothetical protein
MKCLSVRQPYAALILSGRKRIEYRSWRPPPELIGHRLAIHAPTKLDPYARAALARYHLPLFSGAVLGTVRLRDARGEAGNWKWFLADPEALANPVPLSGRLRLFEVEL